MQNTYGLIKYVCQQYGGALENRSKRGKFVNATMLIDHMNEMCLLYVKSIGNIGRRWVNAR
jgi:hypothetical protein